MKPFVTLAEATTPDGSTLTLRRRDGHYDMRVGGHGLMSTAATGSEMRLAELACERCGTRRGTRVLIGGLGFGFTLRRVLELVRTDAKVQVVELLPEVVAWNRAHLQAVNGGLVDDARVEVLIDDVFAVLSRAGAGHYDAVLLDVDNGPQGLTRDSNNWLYSQEGLAAACTALRPGGVLAIWSSTPDKGFGMRLRKAGFDVEEKLVNSSEDGGGERHTIFLAVNRA